MFFIEFKLTSKNPFFLLLSCTDSTCLSRRLLKFVAQINELLGTSGNYN